MRKDGRGIYNIDFYRVIGDGLNRGLAERVVNCVADDQWLKSLHRNYIENKINTPVWVVRGYDVIVLVRPSELSRYGYWAYKPDNNLLFISYSDRIVDSSLCIMYEMYND